MEQEILLKFLDGQTLTATLAAPFQPDQYDIEVRFPDTGMHLSYPLHDLSCILWPGLPDGALPGVSAVPLEDVQTVTGDSFTIITQGLEVYPGGFYGLPVNADPPCGRIFFTNCGVRLRSQRRPLGEILVQYCLLPRTEVDNALQEQQALRQRRAGEVIAEHSRISLDKVEETLRAAETNPTLPRNARVGDILVDAGLVTREEVETAMSVQQEGRKKKIGELLIERGLISEAQLLSALATKFGLRFIDLENQIPSLEALSILPHDLASHLQVVPLQLRRGTLVVATAQPNDPTIGDSLRFTTNRPVELVVARSRQISEAIERYYPKAGA